ncbi:hypothetical protein [Pedobacter chitinilyticus]|uniref:DUF4878 domain-containing protein n=1 Tax=Pedobacter chitinilyticus TaxID=2233776 RepID=A0A3S3R7V9_9SPHI|nr:hypothetical protein [Pedobacter chitinilyticus]RWU09954.1 hypothetical protein DPV69_00990 [Pedobacter chitinilyticus]
MKYIIASFLLVLTSCGNIKPKEKTEDPNLQKLMDTFFEKYKTNPGEAIDFIFKTNTDIAADQVKELKEKLSTISLLAGEYHGQEQITSQKATSSLVYFSFLVKHDKPIRFIFMFYKPKDKWKIYKFKFDDQVDTELEESGKVYFIK